MRNIIKVVSSIIMALGVLGSFLAIQNKDTLYISNYDYRSTKIGVDFNGFKIVQLSDIHNHSYLYENGDLVEKIININPDIIIITGDSIDQHTTLDNIYSIKDMLSRLANYPIYMVQGNHETYANYQEEFYKIFSESNSDNLFYLHDEAVKITRGTTIINLLGVHDPKEDMEFDISYGSNAGTLPQVLTSLNNSLDNDGIKILLSHRPELMDLYDEKNMDLVFSGHTHGGQINLFGYTPYVVNQFPARYVSGEYKKNDTTLIVSSGLGNSYWLPIRFFSKMEIVVTTLYSSN